MRIQLREKCQQGKKPSLLKSNHPENFLLLCTQKCNQGKVLTDIRCSYRKQFPLFCPEGCQDTASWPSSPTRVFPFCSYPPARHISREPTNPPAHPQIPALSGRESSLLKLAPFRHLHKPIDITGPAEPVPRNIPRVMLPMKEGRLIPHQCWQLWGPYGSQNFLFSLKVAGRTINIHIEHIYWRIECRKNTF